MGPTQARIFVPHGILLQFRIHGNYKCSWMIFKDNTLGYMHHRFNLGRNVTYRERKSNFGASETLGLDSITLWQQWWRCYDTYGTNQIWIMKYEIYEMLGQNRASKRVLMWVGEAEWVPTQIGGSRKARKGRTHDKSWAHAQIRIGLILWMVWEP